MSHFNSSQGDHITGDQLGVLLRASTSTILAKAGWKNYQGILERSLYTSVFLLENYKGMAFMNNEVPFISGFPCQFSPTVMADTSFQKK